MYKVKYQGLNASGDGEVSDVFHYTVYGKNGCTIKQADAKKNPGIKVISNEEYPQIYGV